jgi:hypothetical protein
VLLSHFRSFSVILSFIHFFKMSNSVVDFFVVFATFNVWKGSMTTTYMMA